jgi:hypothetical protein
MLAFLAAAFACDAALYRVLAEPPTPATGKGVVTGDSVFDGVPVVGARFSTRSKASVDAWRKVLSRPEAQDDWVPEKFGYDLVEKIGTRHMYLQVNVGFLFGAVTFRRQLVAELDGHLGGSELVSCWKRVEPGDWVDQVAQWRNDADWQGVMAGWWSVRADAEGTIVGHQWWSATAGVPAAVLKFGASSTLPELLDAFEARALTVSTAG